MWVSALRRAAARVAYRALPDLAQSALAMEAARLLPATSPEFFSNDLREISPTLNEDLLDLYGLSEQLLANAFSFHNVAQTLPPDFDWGQCSSAAWRRELHSFDYALPLAMTHRISQEERYALHLRYLIAHWIAENPPGQTAGWELEPLARRVRNWVLAADLARAAWRGDEEFLDVFARSLAMQCAFLGRHSSEAESLATRLDAGRALLIAPKFFGAPASKDLTEIGEALLSKAADEILRGDCSSDPPRPSDLFDLAEACLDRLLFSRPAESASHFSVELARRALAVLEGLLTPDGTLPLFGPNARSRADELSDLYALAAVILNEPRWKHLAGRFGILPYLVMGESGMLRFDQMADEPWASGSREVDECGVYRLSGADRSALMINARRALSPRDHQDFLSYELYLKGIRVVVDSGSYSSENDGMSIASQSAHNVLFGESNRTTARAAIVEGGDWTMPRIQRVARHVASSVNAATEESSWRRVCLNDANFGVTGIHHQRAFIGMDGTAWAVLDRLTGEGRLSLVSLIHFFPTFGLEVLEDRVIARSRALSATIIPLGGFASAGSPGAALEISRGADPKFPGFYSPDFGVKFSCAVLRLTSAEACLPWVGGYLITPGDRVPFRPGQINAHEGYVEFELLGKSYRLDPS